MTLYVPVMETVLSQTYVNVNKVSPELNVSCLYAMDCLEKELVLKEAHVPHQITVRAQKVSLVISVN